MGILFALEKHYGRNDFPQGDLFMFNRLTSYDNSNNKSTITDNNIGQKKYKNILLCKDTISSIITKLKTKLKLKTK